MTPKQRHAIINLVDKLEIGEFVVIQKEDYTGYLPLARLLNSYFRQKSVRKKFRVTMATKHERPCWEIKRVA